MGRFWSCLVTVDFRLIWYSDHNFPLSPVSFHHATQSSESTFQIKPKRSFSLLYFSQWPRQFPGRELLKLTDRRTSCFCRPPLHFVTRSYFHGLEHARKICVIDDWIRWLVHKAFRQTDSNSSDHLEWSGRSQFPKKFNFDRIGENCDS